MFLCLSLSCYKWGGELSRRVVLNKDFRSKTGNGSVSSRGGRRSAGRWAASTTSPLFPHTTSKETQPVPFLSLPLGFSVSLSLSFGPPFLSLALFLFIRISPAFLYEARLIYCDSVWSFVVGTSQQLPLQQEHWTWHEQCGQPFKNHVSHYQIMSNCFISWTNPTMM